MKDYFAFSKVIREKIKVICKELSPEQLNKIPIGFRNNIAWHVGHIVVTSEILCYHRTGIAPEKSIRFVEDYHNGTVPKNQISQDEINYFLNRLSSSIAEIETDYKNGIFKDIQPCSTQTFGIEMKDIETVFECASHHDLLHYGQIQAMKKII